MSITVHTAPPAAPFQVTGRAAARVRELAAEEGEDMVFRIAVTGGGCSGFQYNFLFDDAVTDDDLIVERDGAKVAIDAMSLEYVKGSELQYIEELVGARFEVQNPNATASCGCGTSFSVL